jgi:hypothetical protein
MKISNFLIFPIFLYIHIFFNLLVFTQLFTFRFATVLFSFCMYLFLIFLITLDFVYLLIGLLICNK